MRIEVLDDAKDDLIVGFRFYEEQAPGLGSYFLDSLFSDIDSLLLYAGIHRIVYGSHRRMGESIPVCDLLPCRGECYSRESRDRLQAKSYLD